MNMRHEPTIATRLLGRFILWSEQVSLARRVMLIAILLGGSALADLATGAKASMNLFYVLVTVLGGWWFGMRGGAVVALLNTAVISSVLAVLDDFKMPVAMLVWNISVRVFVHLLYATLASGLRQTLENERWLANYDALTGALNVRAFHARSAEVVAAARRRGERLLIGYLDLDGFKGVNDRYGHAAGDQVLQGFAATAQAVVRRQDLFARVGGDEFALMLAIKPGERGEDLAELIHARLSAVLADTGYAVSCSMGAVVLEPEAITSAEAALARADALMYEVKQDGRDALRLVHLGTLTPPTHRLTSRAAEAVAA